MANPATMKFCRPSRSSIRRPSSKSRRRSVNCSPSFNSTWRWAAAGRLRRRKSKPVINTLLNPFRFPGWWLGAALAIAGGGAIHDRVEAASLKPVALRTEYCVDPLGTDETQPRLSWQVESKSRGEKQTAFQILVASSPKLLQQDQGDLWDSGKLAGDETIGTVYAGTPLVSQEHCYWKVCVWDRDGHAIWSHPAEWSMGLLKPEDWQAGWIGYDAERLKLARQSLAASAEDGKKVEPYLPPVPYFRKNFNARRSIVRATLYASALGLVEVHLNGHRISEDFFTPGWTDYDQRVHYRTYDVTPLVRRGENALGAVLADGWYSGYVGYGGKRDHYGKLPRVRLQLQLEYADGTSAIVGTGPDWKAMTGPV